MVPMATISPNEYAPEEAVKYIFPLETFDLGPGGSHETEDRNTLSAAEAHPWLDVKYPDFPELSEEVAVGGVPYEDDVLAAPNSHAFDYDAIRAEIESRKAVELSKVALDSGLDQSDPVVTAGVAETLAAADEDVENAHERTPEQQENPTTDFNNDTAPDTGEEG